MWQRPVGLLFAMLGVACGGENLTLPGSSDAIPTTLTIVSGDSQTATVGHPVPAPLVVQWADAVGHPVAGATVTFRFSGDYPDAAVDPASPATDAEGRASASARLGTIAGDQPLQAQVVTPGKDLLVMFQLRALAEKPPGGGGQGGGSSGPPSGGDSGNPGNGGNGGGSSGGSGGGGGGGSGGSGGGHHDGGGAHHDKPKGGGHGQGNGGGDRQGDG
ncbi:MAG TPA: Ig-like domain-containing protein, partial [Gemmatimonadales bacterium]|nr:Ig-like domain-containing protein [Gemmatimonadales bacterium]